MRRESAQEIDLERDLFRRLSTTRTESVRLVD